MISQVQNRLPFKNTYTRFVDFRRGEIWHFWSRFWQILYNFFLGPSHRLCHIRYDKDKNHSKFDFDKFEFCFIKSDEPSQWRRPSINKRTANNGTTGSYDSKRTNLNEKYAKRTYTGRIGKFIKTFMIKEIQYYEISWTADPCRSGPMTVRCYVVSLEDGL